LAREHFASTTQRQFHRWPQNGEDTDAERSIKSDTPSLKSSQRKKERELGKKHSPNQQADTRCGCVSSARLLPPHTKDFFGFRPRARSFLDTFQSQPRLRIERSNFMQMPTRKRQPAAFFICGAHFFPFDGGAQLSP